MEIRVFGMVLLLVLSAALPAEAQSWEAFKKKHIYLSMPENRCTREIKKRNINIGVACKAKNSFIRATDAQVKAVCGRAGHRVDGKLYESNLPFSVVTCIRNGSRPCRYDGRQRPRYITLACEGGFPVHYERERSDFLKGAI